MRVPLRFRPLVSAGRTIDKKYGDAWTLFFRWMRFYFEVNVGRDRKR